jgi:transposase
MSACASNNELLVEGEATPSASANPRPATLWAFTPMDYGRVQLGTLEDAIDKDDVVRLFAEILSQCDWSAWEAKYPGKRGRPPIHPRPLAGVMLWGMCRAIRSSRRLEEACKYRLDFRWLARGLRPDHSTLSDFRRRFKKPLKDLFRQINRMAMTMGLISMGQIAYDGTRVKAYNSRYKTYTKEKIEAKLKELDDEFEEAMQKFEQEDNNSDGGGSATKLPEHLATIDDRRAALRDAKERIEELETQRRASGLKTTAQLPINDSDSRVMPNKEGGYAPNYTPTATTDGAHGFIVDCDVLNTVNEGNGLVTSVDTVRNDYGQPEAVMTDSGNNSGENLQAMTDRQIVIYTPVKSTEPSAESPVRRSNLRQPIPASEYSQLPKNSHGKLDKSCFVYVPEEDKYYCPQGKPLKFRQTKREGSMVIRAYRCNECQGCPLVEQCVEQKNERGRTIRRDQYESIRNATAQRMSTPEAKAQYNQRPMIAETPFAILKNVMGIRQFLLRGLDNVKTEWRWYATAFNAVKLARLLGILRADTMTVKVTG